MDDLEKQKLLQVPRHSRSHTHLPLHSHTPTFKILIILAAMFYIPPKLGHFTLRNNLLPSFSPTANSHAAPSRCLACPMQSASETTETFQIRPLTFITFFIRALTIVLLALYLWNSIHLGSLFCYCKNYITREPNSHARLGSQAAWTDKDKLGYG